MILCRGCRMPVVFIRMTSGKSMPVDPEYIDYSAAKHGSVLITDDGVTIVVAENVARPGVRGRISHFASCTCPAKFRKANKMIKHDTEETDLSRAKLSETTDCACAFVSHGEKLRILQNDAAVGIPRKQLKQLLRQIADNYGPEMDAFLRGDEE